MNNTKKVDFMKWNLLAILVYFLSFQLIAQKSNLEKSGDFLSVALPVAAYATTQIWRDDQKSGWRIAAAIGTSTILTHSLKRIVNKKRPNGGSYSFPSGHTSSAFTGAAFIQKRHGWKAGIPAFLVASYVGWTRIYANKHDYWDLLGGSIIGIGSAYLFAKPYNKNKIDLSFYKSDKYYILCLNYRFAVKNSIAKGNYP